MSSPSEALEAAEDAARDLLVEVLEVAGLESWQRLAVLAAASSYGKTLARRIAAECAAS